MATIILKRKNAFEKQGQNPGQNKGVITVGPIIPWQVAPQQSLPPLHRTVQYTLQINTKPRRRKVFIKSENRLFVESSFR